MLHPRSVAVVGATPRSDYGGKFLMAALQAGDRVRVYPVNPRYETIRGLTCYPSVTDLPESPDLVGIVVPYSNVLDVLTESHRKGARAAIVISAGFAERASEDRRELQSRLQRFASESGLRFSGPNCLGIANVREDFWTFPRPTKGQKGSVGIVCQSGATAFATLHARAVDAGVGLSLLISTGNEADLEFSDFARYLIEDPNTSVVAGLVEGFKDARKFIEVARLAGRRGKPIVLIKVGRSNEGARAARSHTAAFTGVDAVFDAAFRQYGVIRVDDYDELLEVCQLLAHTKSPGPGVAVVSHSGGVGSLTADLCSREGVSLPPLTESGQKAIAQVLGGFGSAANPADVTGMSRGEPFTKIMSVLLNEPDVGTLVVASAGDDDHAERVIAQRGRADKDIVYLWTGSRFATDGLPKLKAANMPIVYEPTRLAVGLKRLERYREWRSTQAEERFLRAPAATGNQAHALRELANLGRAVLSDHEAKRLIAAWGIPVARELLATSASEAVRAAELIGYPVALKIDSPDVPHKTDLSAVLTDLRSNQDVNAAYTEIRERVRRHAPTARINGVLVQEMVQDAVEVIAGVSHDAQLGPVLLFGVGGTMVEIYDDVALRLCPIETGEALRMIQEVRGGKLLAGYRGTPRADVDALAAALVRLSQLAVTLETELATLEMNPLMVLPIGRGVKAVDALASLTLGGI